MQKTGKLAIKGVAVPRAIEISEFVGRSEGNAMVNVRAALAPLAPVRSGGYVARETPKYFEQSHSDIQKTTLLIK